MSTQITLYVMVQGAFSIFLFPDNTDPLAPRNIVRHLLVILSAIKNNQQMFIYNQLYIPQLMTMTMTMTIHSVSLPD